MTGNQMWAPAVGATDRELWDESGRQRSEVFGVLFERHAKAIYNFCFRQTGSWSAAEDLVSVVFLEALRRHRSVSLHHDSALPWLYGVATNVCRNSIRSTRRHRAALNRIRAESTGSGAAEPDPADRVSARVDGEQRMRDLRGAIADLPRREQDVLALVVWSGLDYAAAAAALDIPVGTVRSRLSRARARLSAALPVALPEEEI